METDNNLPPVILSLSSHDPSGSSGIQADIESAVSLGCHCAAIVTSLITKDTRQTHGIVPVESSLIIEQARSLLEDMPIKAIKVGFVGSVANAEAIHSILRDYPHLPVILEPTSTLCNNYLADMDSIRLATDTLLLPLATVATPDLIEAHDLAPQGDTIDACAHEILESGCEYLLISGAKRSNSTYENHLYTKRGLIRTHTWPRLKVLSYGSGATLAASIACYFAHGLQPEEAIALGQRFAWNALSKSRRLGMGLHIPNRLFWASDDSATALENQS